MAQQAKSKKQPSLISEYLHTFARGWQFIFIGAAIGLLAAFLINAASPPLYRARTLLDVQVLNQSLVTTRTGKPSSEDISDGFEFYIQTQIKLLESDSVIHLAVKRMKASPGPIPAHPAAPSGLLAFLEPKPMKRDQLIDDAVNRLAVNRLKVRPRGVAGLIEITCDSPDANVTADFCNSLSDAFIKQNLDTRNDTAVSTSTWLSKQLEDVKDKLTESEHELQSEAQKSELLYANGKKSDGETRLRELQSELSKAQAERMIRQAQYETAKDSEINGGPSSVESQNARKEHASSLDRMKSDLEAAQQRENMLQASYLKQEALVDAQLGATAHYELLKASVESQRQLYQTLTQRAKEAGFAPVMRSSSIHVVDRAVAPAIPFSPRKVPNLVAGAILGCLCGFGIVLFRRRTDSQLRLPGDAMQALNVWELGVIPAAAADRKALIADAYRSTMSSLLVRMNQSESGSVFVLSSPSASEGKTTVISNLGIAFAEARWRVLLIDGDMQRPALHKIFELNNGVGLREVLRGAISIDKTPIGLLAQPTSVPRLFVMPAGTGKEASAGLLHSEELPTLLARVRKEFDVVLIDTPPMLQMADARLFARQGDGVVLVVRSGSTTAQEAVTAQYMFQQDFTSVIGVVLNDFHPAKEARYRY